MSRIVFLNLLKEKLKTSNLKTDNDLLTIFSEHELILFLFRNKPASSNSLRLTRQGKEVFSRFFKLWEIDLILDGGPIKNISWTIINSINTHELVVLNRYLKSPWFYDHTISDKIWLSGDDEVSYLKLFDGNVKNFVSFCSNSLDSQ